MGGDGGVIASNRRYLRGAGSASHTADRARTKRTQEEEHQECRETMRNCALTGETLLFLPAPTSKSNGSDLETSTSDSTIVACPYGKLYGREAAVEALLRRKATATAASTNGSAKLGEEDETNTSGLGSHIRGLKDLHTARFHLTKKKTSNKMEYIPTCPITGDELNGIQPAFVIVKTKLKTKSKSNNELDENVNVLSERAIKEMGTEALQAEYGPFEKDSMIRLAPHQRDLESIKEKLLALREEQLQLKKSKKKSSKKRSSEDLKSQSTSISKTKKVKEITSTSINNKNNLSHSTDAVSMARINVASAVATNSALSSLFNKNKSSLSEKEKNDNLFVR